MCRIFCSSSVSFEVHVIDSVCIVNRKVKECRGRKGREKRKRMDEPIRSPTQFTVSPCGLCTNDIGVLAPVPPLYCALRAGDGKEPVDSCCLLCLYG